MSVNVFVNNNKLDYLSIDQYFEMSSIGEKKALKLMKEEPLAFVQYNTKQICRTYPAGNRLDSSNYDPHNFWNIGTQMGELFIVIGTQISELVIVIVTQIEEFFIYNTMSYQMSYHVMQWMF